MDLMQRRRVMLAAGKKTRLPSEYQEVEWIQSTGTQYIVTNLFPQWYWKTEAKFTIIEYGNNTTCIFGAQNNSASSQPASNRRGYVLNLYNGWQFKYADSIQWDSAGSASANTPYTAMILPSTSSGVLYINGQSVKSRAQVSTPWSVNYKLSLFALNNYGSIIFPSKVRYMEHKIYDYQDDNPIASIIPCYRKLDSKPGMYDLVNNVFYTNNGTGEFIVGPDVFRFAA